MLEYFKNLKITPKFILWFLFVALAPLAVATNISYNNYRKVLEEEVAKSLVAVADNKTNQVESYLNEKEKNVNTLSNMSDMVDVIQKFSDAFNRGGFDSQQYALIDKEYSPFLTYYQKSFGLEDLLLIRNSGEIIFSIKKKRDPRSLFEVASSEDSQLAKVFVKTAKSSKAAISDFEYLSYSRQASVYISSPIFNGSDFLGALVCEMDNKGISELVKDYRGLGQTGEIIIAAKLKEKASFITPLRFDADAAFKRKIDTNSKEGAYLLKAVEGENAIGRFIDYRDKEVVAVSRYLPAFRWGIVVKMDTDEIFSSADRLRNNLLKLGLALLIIVVIMAVVIANSISSPIKALTVVSANIAGGDLSARAKVHSKDEIGELAHSFNKMTDSLVEAKANVEQKKEEVEEQKRLLEKANKELDSFVYTASHDLRAPLRGITAFANFLYEDYNDKLDSEGKDNLKEIRDGTKRMSDLIEDLLALSRISRIKNPYEDVDINGLVKSVIKRIEYDIKEHKVDLVVQERMPVVKCDRIKMNEVFLNLINNAIKFSSKNNKENPRVEVGYIDDNEFHKFFVRDNGIGIDPKYHSQVFELFRRLHTQEQYEGTGAGLSIVKKVIDDHNGDIWVESELGKGAAFYFKIPKDLKKRHKKIGEILLESGILTEEQLKDILKKQGV
jgi:signal transduction histidine kinase